MGPARCAASILFLALLRPMGIPADGADRQAAFAYVEQARVLADSGSEAEARALLEDALLLHPDFSEACRLYARLELRAQEGTLAAVAWLKRALASQSWVDTPAETALVELARTLVRIRRYDEARSVLSALGVRPGLGPRDDPEAALLWGQALSGLGRTSEAAAYLAEALRRYPQDRRLYLHLARTLQRIGRTSDALEVLSRGRRELPQAPELSLEAARLTPARSTRLALLEEYAQRGGEQPEAAALALTLQPRDPQALLERFLSQGGLSRLLPLDMLSTYFRARPGRTAERLLAAVRQYSGQRIVDADEDGYYEEKYWVSDGALERWLLDADQDGAPEAEARFRAGQIQTFSAGGLEYRYSSYPFLEEVSVRGSGLDRLYRLQPFQVRLEPFQGAPVLSAPARLSPLRLALRDTRWPGEQEVRSWSYALLEYEPGSGTLRRRFALSGSSVVRLEEEPDGRGRFARIVEYERGIPASGRRDLDGDGRFELREEYVNGKLAALVLDQDGNLRPEYRQEFSAEGTRSEWDYDQDGVMDSRELERPGGEVVREFSSRLNGTFDCRAVFRSDRLVSFQRAGQPLMVSPSSNPALFWVGRGGGPVEPFLSLPEGLHWVGGRQYFLFIHRGIRYVAPL